MLISAHNLAESLSPLVLEQVKIYPNYRVVVCGHSLGAGTAALLYAIWRHSTAFKRVKMVGHAHAVPGVASSNLKYDDNFISTCLGWDVVPR